MKTKFGIISIVLITMLMGFSYAEWHQEIPADISIETGYHDVTVEFERQDEHVDVKDYEFSESFEIFVERKRNNGSVTDVIIIQNNGNIPMEIAELELDFEEMKKNYTIDVTEGEGEEAVVVTEFVEDELSEDDLIFDLEIQSGLMKENLNSHQFVRELEDELSGSWYPGEVRSFMIVEKVNENSQGASYTWSYTLNLETVVYR
ncbi:MAG: hypothetical protein K9L62_14205 [Vallitaleaceae bacterium]|nr:hypothetical protein [Vallitaleaceae bacterium]